MPRAFSLDIEVGRVSTVDVTHDPGEVAKRGFDQQMVMVAHQTVGMNNSAIALGSGLQIGEEFQPIGGISKDILAFIPS